MNSHIDHVVIGAANLIAGTNYFKISHYLRFLQIQYI